MHSACRGVGMRAVSFATLTATSARLPVPGNEQVCQAEGCRQNKGGRSKGSQAVKQQGMAEVSIGKGSAYGGRVRKAAGSEVAVSKRRTAKCQARRFKVQGSRWQCLGQ